MGGAMDLAVILSSIIWAQSGYKHEQVRTVVASFIVSLFNNLFFQGFLWFMMLYTFMTVIASY